MPLDIAAAQDWRVKMMMGVQFRNPLRHGSIGIIDSFEHEGENRYGMCPIRTKFKNFDLPEGFTQEEYEELNEFWEQINK